MTLHAAFERLFLRMSCSASLTGSKHPEQTWTEEHISMCRPMQDAEHANCVRAKKTAGFRAAGFSGRTYEEVRYG